MKFTSKFAVSALMLALSSSWVWAGSTTATLEAQIAKLNSLKSQSTVATDAGIDAENFKILSSIIKDDFASKTTEDKLKYLETVKTRFEKVVQTYTFSSINNQAAQTAKKSLELLQKPQEILQQESLIQTQVAALRNYPLEVELLQRQLELQPLLHSQAQHFAVQAAQEQLHVDLYQDLRSSDVSRVLGLSSGLLTQGEGIQLRANQVALGYQHTVELPYPVTRATGAVFAHLISAQAQSRLGKQDFTFQHQGVFGGGVYGAVRHGKIQLATLGTLSQGKQQVNAYVDHSDLVSKLNDANVVKTLEPQLLTRAQVASQARTFNYLVGLSYDWQLQPSWVLTPTLLYHYHSFMPSSETVTWNAGATTNSSTAQQSAILEFRKQTPFVPRLSQQGMGGLLNIGYQVNRQLMLGASTSALFYRGNLSQGTAAVVELERPVPGMNGAQEKYRAAQVVWQPHNIEHWTWTGAAHANYAFTPQLQLKAQLGYSVTTQRQQAGLNYGLQLAITY